MINEFLEAGGTKSLLFFYKSVEAMSSVETAKLSARSLATMTILTRQAAAAASVKPANRLDVVDAHSLATMSMRSLKGVCVFFSKNSVDVTLTGQNIASECFSLACDFQSEHMLAAISRQLGALFLPVLSSMSDSYWGQIATASPQQQQSQQSKRPSSSALGRSQTDARLKSDFLNKMAMCVSVLDSAQTSMSDQLVLTPCIALLSTTTTTATSTEQPNNSGVGGSTTPSMTTTTTPTMSSETLAAIEETVRTWMREIQAVLTESEQIRHEAENVGPRAELDYWKRRTGKFKSLFDQIKSGMVKSAIGVLHAAKARTLLDKWRQLDAQITDVANEARDNVRYLYTLERFCDPLYDSDPVEMVEGGHIAGLINAIRMIHSISSYYNTPERLTSLFLKVLTFIALELQLALSITVVPGSQHKCQQNAYL